MIDFNFNDLIHVNFKEEGLTGTYKLVSRKPNVCELAVGAKDHRIPKLISIPYSIKKQRSTYFKENVIWDLDDDGICIEVIQPFQCGDLVMFENKPYWITEIFQHKGIHYPKYTLDNCKNSPKYNPRKLCRSWYNVKSILDYTPRELVGLMDKGGYRHCMFTKQTFHSRLQYLKEKCKSEEDREHYHNLKRIWHESPKNTVWKSPYTENNRPSLQEIKSTADFLLNDEKFSKVIKEHNIDFYNKLVDMEKKRIAKENSVGNAGD